MFLPLCLAQRGKEAQHQRVQMELQTWWPQNHLIRSMLWQKIPAGTFAVRYDYYEVMNGFAADVSIAS